jgi:hypothetical protein
MNQIFINFAFPFDFNFIQGVARIPVVGWGEECVCMGEGEGAPWVRANLV